jgi:hypothetical protein
MRTVVVCASKKYRRDVARFCKNLEKLGVVVFEPSFSNPPITEEDLIHSDFVTKKIFKGLTLEHFNWIRKADVCFIFNKSNYAGASVSLEMGYATALDKPIYALSDKTGDPCRDALIDKVAKTPAALVKLL